MVQIKSFFKKTMTICASATALMAVTSCTDFDNGFSSREHSYNEIFESMFTNIDQNQNWNTATHAAIDVNIAFEGDYTVKVYTANPRYSDNEVYLLGQFDNVSEGKRTFLCDVPSTLDYVYVGLIDKNQNRMILPGEVKDGKVSVNFGGQEGTRTTIENSGEHVVSSAGNYHEWTLENLKLPISTLPEGTMNAGKVTQNFEYLSTGEFTLYPIYTITSNSGPTAAMKSEMGVPADSWGEWMGIYVYNSWGGIVDSNNDGVPDITWVWHMNTGEYTKDDNNNYTLTKSSWFQAHKSGTDANTWENTYWFYNGALPMKLSNEDKEGLKQYCVWSNYNQNFTNNVDKIRSEGIKISVPAGRKFGIVLATDGGYYFSNSQWNKDQGSLTTGSEAKELDHIKDTYAATFHDQGNMYLSFEDWNYATGSDHDYNDIVLKLETDNNTPYPLIIDKDSEVNPLVYIVACEDLGGTYDWDFNDVVFGIEHVSGQTKARVKLLAAGGTLPVNIKYNNDDIKFTRNGNSNITDLHKAFGDGYEETPINVGDVTLTPVYSNEFTVDANEFSVISDASQFKVHVKYNDGTESSTIGLPNSNDTETKAPQAFLIADPNWQWPSEKQCITEKYPEFTSWVADADKTSWCGSVWGKVREFESIPSYAVKYKEGGNIQCNGNIATITLGSRTSSNTYWTSGATYKLLILVDEDASINFKLGNQNISTLSNGTIEKNKVHTFTITPEIVEQFINDTANEPCATITFANGITASEKLRTVNWYMENTSVYCGLEFVDRKDNTELSLNTPYNGDVPTYQIKWTTNDQHVPVKFESDNTSVATVSEDGLITAVGAGEAKVRMYQSYWGTGVNGVYGGNRYINVKVNKRNANLKVPSDCQVLLLSQWGDAATFDVTTSSPAPISVSSNNSSTISVSADGKKITVNPGSIGTTSFTIKQEATDAFNASETITVTAKVLAFSNFEDIAANASHYDSNLRNNFTLYNSTEVVWGDGNVYYDNYIDLSAYTYLKLTVTATESNGVPRFLFNRLTNNGDLLDVRPDQDTKKYMTVVSNSNGSKTYYVNLKSILSATGYCRLHAIKTPYNTKITASYVGISNTSSSAKRRNAKK